MPSLNRIVDTITERRAVISLCVLTCVLEVLFLLRIVWPPSFKFMLDYHIFEIVVLVALAQIVLLLLRLLRRTPRHICKNESECEQALREFLRSDDRAKTLHVLSAGLSSRMTLITSMHEERRGLVTQVLAQNPECAVDTTDGKGMQRHFDVLVRDHADVPLHLRLFDVPATLRALIVCDAKKKPIWGVASWYRYERTEPGKDGVRVIGRRNPAFVLRRERSTDDETMLIFLMDCFKAMWTKNDKNAVLPAEKK